MKREDIFSIDIWSRGYYDTENGNPYYAYRVVIKLKKFAHNVILECDGDWGSCGEEDIRRNWIFPAIQRTFGLELSEADVKSGFVKQASYKKVYKIDLLENPRLWKS